MLWSRKRGGPGLPAERELPKAEALPVALDKALFERHFEELLAGAGRDAIGVEGLLAALQAKHQRIAAISRIRPFGLLEAEQLLAEVFTARRRLYPALERLGAARVEDVMRSMEDDDIAIDKRIQSFVDAMPGTSGIGRSDIKSAAKVRRAAWDFAAELLHFGDPVRFPLMSRWVWDATTQSGALREFIRGADTLREVALENRPEVFEGARRWLAERLSEKGIYRDEVFWIDLVLAQAYVTYFRSMAEGSLGADFGRGVTPHEQLKKLLGIDVAPKGRSRVKKSGLEGRST